MVSSVSENGSPCQHAPGMAPDQGTKRKGALHVERQIAVEIDLHRRAHRGGGRQRQREQQACSQ
jgi:hypothetical protein